MILTGGRRRALALAGDAGAAALLLVVATGIEMRPRAVAPKRVAQEIFHSAVHLRKYPSTIDPSLELWALVHLPTEPSCILVTSHGWHGALEHPKSDDVRRERLVVDVDMRGRAYSSGSPDLSGWELHDWVDAVEFVRREYAEHISDPDCVYAEGGSGAGGNVYAIVGKFPDFFSAAVVHSGMSDYTLQYEHDETGEFRDEMEGAGWIGGDAQSNPEGYRSRGGMTTVGNLLTPIHINHGETDVRVPVVHARRYVSAARSDGRTVGYIEWPGVGDRRHWTHMTPEQQEQLRLEIADWYEKYQRPPALPDEGTFTVAGYLVASSFEVVLEHIDHVAEMRFRIEDGALRRFELSAATTRQATVRFRWPKGAPVRLSLGERDLSARRVRDGAWVEVDMAVGESPEPISVE